MANSETFQKLTHQKLAFVTDFDGTITDDDFFQYVKEAFFDDAALAPWYRYIDGELSHFDALKQIYRTLKVSEAELTDLVKSVKIDKWVIPTFKLLNDAQIPIYIASAGCDYYIKLLVGAEIEKYKITLVTNPSSYTQAGGLAMERPPETSPYYDKSFGISKMKIVKHLQDSGKHVIFAGDGPPDIEPARLADKVFAKKILLNKCIEEGIKTEEFDNFKNIYDFFDEHK